MVVVQPIPANLGDYVVADFVRSDGSWDINGFIYYIPNVVLQEVVASLPQTLTAHPDVPIWGYTSSGVYTASSAYDMLTENLRYEPLDPTWRLLWCWKGAPRVRLFL